jgi:hypothetical protein
VKSSEGLRDFRARATKVESILRKAMKTKRRELFLLLCYAAVLVPTAANGVLCLNGSCADRIQAEPRVPCCCAELERVEPALRAEGKRAEHGSNTLAFGRTRCGCVVVPLGKDDPQLTEKTDSQPTTPPRVAAALSPSLGPKDPVISCQAPGHVPADIGKLSTIILLI